MTARRERCYAAQFTVAIESDGTLCCLSRISCGKQMYNICFAFYYNNNCDIVNITSDIITFCEDINVI